MMFDPIICSWSAGCDCRRVLIGGIAAKSGLLDLLSVYLVRNLYRSIKS